MNDTSKFLSIWESPDEVEEFQDTEYSSDDSITFGFHNGQIVTTEHDVFKDWSKEKHEVRAWHSNLSKAVGNEGGFGREKLSPSGRIWSDAKFADYSDQDGRDFMDRQKLSRDERVIIISFWQPPNEEQISEVLTEFSDFLGDHRVFVQTKPSNDPEPIENIFQGLKKRGTAEKLGTADKELMAMQHLSPEVKKYARAGSEELANVGASKLSASADEAGYDTPAEYNFMRRQESTDIFLNLLENELLSGWMPAVKTPLGTYKASHHFSAMRDYAKDLWQTNDPKDLAHMFAEKHWDELTQDTEDGFVTSEGDFLNREDAFDYWTELGGKPGQGYIGKGERNWLDSEDLHDNEPEDIDDAVYDDEFDDRMIGLKLGFNESGYHQYRILIEARMEPWRLEYKEYYDLVNPGDKRHEDDVYDWSLTGKEVTKGGHNRHTGEYEELRTEYVSELDWITKANYNYLLKTIDGIEYRMEKRKNTYSKREDEPDETGWREIVRDEKGLAVTMTDDEIAQQGLATHAKTIVAFDGDVAVAMASDEWGAVLIAVLREYRSRGIGTNIGFLYRSMYPDKGSGGMTSGGRNQLYRIWQKFVARALDTGKFQAAIKKGTFDVKKADQILKQYRGEYNYNYG